MFQAALVDPQYPGCAAASVRHFVQSLAGASSVCSEKGKIAGISSLVPSLVPSLGLFQGAGTPRCLADSRNPPL